MPHRVTELQCIMPLHNVPSVMQHGILSYERAARLAHRSVAMPEIQDRRDKVQVPGGLRLHQYANLYFHARNPMMYKRKDEAAGLCVLRVSPAVLELDNVVLSDQNASSGYVRFLSPAQMGAIKFDLVYAPDWRHPGNQVAYWQHRAAKCAEVLVPNQIPFELVVGAYVVNIAVQHSMQRAGFDRPIIVEPDLFFH